MMNRGAMPRYVEPLFRPPSEARSLIFQITIGCSQNQCTFCGMYRSKRFQVRGLDVVLAEIAAIPEATRQLVERVFLADGDALIYPYEELVAILRQLGQVFPRLARVGSYASPHSLLGKSVDQLQGLREHKLRILYFGLESGDDRTLAAVNKGYAADCMAQLATKARQAGIKLSVTAILGLAGQERSLEHARATAAWINRVNPEYFSLLTLFHRHNERFIDSLQQCSYGDLLLEARELLLYLEPQRTILRSNHVSNFLELAGSYPKDRQRLLADVEQAVAQLRTHPELWNCIPVYREEYL